MVLAFSYLRFSSEAQEDGDSTRRQDALRDAWLKRHPDVRLAEAFTDRGVSGFRGKHRTSGDLARFLDLVTHGSVPRGSYLIVENLDRLTRESPIEALPAVLGLIKAGVRVVQLAPTEVVYDSEMDQGVLMMMLWEISRGHGESKRKSGAVGEAKREAKRAARDSGRPIGNMAPAWLELVDGKYRVKANAGPAVRLIFRMCAEGSGVLAITKKLNADRVAPLGRSARWITSYVAKILDNRACIGEYQPMSNGRPRTPDGDPIPGYYPAVVTEAEFHAAAKARESRHRRSGRPAKNAVHLFTGLLQCARDACPIYFTTRSKRKYLISARALNGETPMVTFPMDEFQSAVLSQLRELQASDLFSDPSAEEVARLTASLGESERRLGVAVTRFEADPDNTTWQRQIDKYDRECRALRLELAEKRQAAANPTSNTWAEVLSEVDPQRLHAALLRTIDRIHCVTVIRGEDRVLGCQVQFRDSAAVRSYIIRYTPGKGGFAPREASSRCWSTARLGVSGDLDLRQPSDASALSSVLATIGLPE